jgi:succinate dehydrogenase / fumarate reductase iron-sulfur subunit
MATITLKIRRFNPDTDSSPHFEAYEIEAAPTDRILDCLNKIRWQLDSSLAYRMSCGHGICGSDGMVINGKTCLACQELVGDFDYSKGITVEPLQYFKVIKDLVVDIDPFFEGFREIHPAEPQAQPTVEKERLQSIEDRAKFDDAIKCIACACCTASCPVDIKEDPLYVGPAAVLRAFRYIFDSRFVDADARMQIMNKPHGIWACKTYYRCTVVCPKGIKVTKAILEAKDRIRPADKKQQP